VVAMVDSGDAAVAGGRCRVDGGQWWWWWWWLLTAFVDIDGEPANAGPWCHVWNQFQKESKIKNSVHSGPLLFVIHSYLV
jgi:hypothetical protein